MSDALKLAMTITAADLASGVLRRLRTRITGTGAAAKQVQKDFDNMVSSINRGVKAFAVAGYITAKLKPGVKASADLQESMLGVKQLLWDSGKNAATLAKQLSQVRNTAVQVSANLPNSATDLVKIQGNLLQGGVPLQSVVGPHGAAFATAALSAVGKLDPEYVSETLAKIGHAYQLKGNQYGSSADVLARVSSSSAANLQELLYNIRQVGPAAHALNIPLKDTSIALASVASLGNEAGTNLRQFFIGLAGATPQAQKALRAMHISFFDKKNGQFVGMDEALKRLRLGLSRIHGQQNKMIILQRLFQTEGAQAARLLLQTGQKSYEEIKKNTDAAAGLAQRMKIWGDGLNASMEKLSGTTSTTLAAVFNPMLKPLREAVDETNKLVSNVGVLADKHKGFAKSVSYGTAGIAAAIGGYGLYKLFRGAVSGGRFLKGLRGLRGTAVGVAEGKAIQAATGVTPVFVTNMPAGGIPGGIPGGGAPSAAENAASSSIAARAKSLLRYGKSGLKWGAGALSGLLDIPAAAVAASGGIGYLAGTGLYKGTLKGTVQSDAIGHAVARLLSFFGDKTASRWYNYNQHRNDHLAQHMRGEVVVRVRSDPGLKASTEHVHSNTDKLHVQAETEAGGRNGGDF